MAIDGKRAEIMTQILSESRNKHECPYKAKQSSNNAFSKDSNDWPNITLARWKADHHLFIEWVIPSLGLEVGHAGRG
jgi:hypothetical protein